MRYRRTHRWFPLFILSSLMVTAHAAEDPPIGFEDVTDTAGITFRHDNGMQGDWQYPEIVGGGCGLVDIDEDGRLDIVFVQSGALPVDPADADPPDRSASGGSRLYRNISEDGTVRFEDVTDESGLRAYGHGMGVATGDLTGDGRMDLYITNFGPNSLWRNDGGGRFTDITAEAGVGDPAWGTSASVADINGDGHLDIYVANYVDYDPQVNPHCFAPSTRRDYCGPAVFEPARDTLYLNDGKGRFTDATDALAGGEPQRGLGVVVSDFDQDGRADIYVANDGDPNLLWRNQGEGRFSEFAWPSGTAVNRSGQMEAGMGVDAGDADNDGTMDLFLTHLSGESNTLYRNIGNGLFEDRSADSGLAVPSLPYTGFGTGWMDLDLDGWLDVFIVNGGVRVIEAQRDLGVAFPLQQTPLVFRNRGEGRFEDISATLADALGPATVGRGLAQGDVDNDGRVDVLLCSGNGDPRLLINRSTGNPWLGVRATTGEPARDALGATVALLAEGKPALWRRVATDGSYLSARDPRAVFGLGARDGDRHDILVTWADGRVERFAAVETGRYTTLHQGRGETLETMP